MFLADRYTIRFSAVSVSRWGQKQAWDRRMRFVMGAKTWLSQTYNRLPPLFAPNYAWLWAESLSPTCYAPQRIEGQEPCL
jgi:hypothetical protein